MRPTVIIALLAAAVLAGTAGAASMNAAQIVNGLRHSEPIAKVKVYTAASDPNHLLGRPNGYVSCAHFVDRRVAHSDTTDAFDISNGGAVELWHSHADAVSRANSIQKILKAAPLLGSEYDYAIGNVLVRVSGDLTPAQARSYKAAATRVLG